MTGENFNFSDKIFGFSNGVMWGSGAAFGASGIFNLASADPKVVLTASLIAGVGAGISAAACTTYLHRNIRNDAARSKEEKTKGSTENAPSANL